MSIKIKSGTYYIQAIELHEAARNPEKTKGSVFLGMFGGLCILLFPVKLPTKTKPKRKKNGNKR
jgi:hypothetical protein